MALGIAVSSLYEYQRQYPEFSEVMRVGAEDANAAVVNSLFDECIGYYYLETRAVFAHDADTIPSRVEISLKYHPPNVRGIITWLTRRCPERWAAPRTETSFSERLSGEIVVVRDA